MGLGLMIVNRLSGLVLPTTTKYFVDDVIGQGRWELLPRLAMAAGGATIVDAATAFANSQVLGVAAQRAITAVRIDPVNCTSPVPTRFLMPSASVMMREMRMPLFVESK